VKAQSRSPQPTQSKAQPKVQAAQTKSQPAQSKAQPARSKAQTPATKAPAAKEKAQATKSQAQSSKAHPAKAPAAKGSAATKATATKAPEPKAAVHKAPARPAGKPKGDRAAFMEKQRQLLLEERDQYLRSAEALKAQADSLALEHEPGDVQFDEEGGEGGTSNIDREMDLVLSAQARTAAAEIDRALAKIEAGTYGFCEQCGQPIPDARLQALPYAALCVSCKSGGLSARR
jgi:DnaK suppressor protein